jgi:hypothetical protein
MSYIHLATEVLVSITSCGTSLLTAWEEKEEEELARGGGGRKRQEHYDEAKKEIAAVEREKRERERERERERKKRERERELDGSVREAVQKTGSLALHVMVMEEAQVAKSVKIVSL